MQKVTSKWGVRVKHALVDRGMSVTELAAQIGKTRSYVSAIISGRHFSPEVVDKIAEELGIDNHYDVRVVRPDPAEEMIARFNAMVSEK